MNCMQSREHRAMRATYRCPQDSSRSLPRRLPRSESIHKGLGRAVTCCALGSRGLRTRLYGSSTTRELRDDASGARSSPRSGTPGGGAERPGRAPAERAFAGRTARLTGDRALCPRDLAPAEAVGWSYGLHELHHRDRLRRLLGQVVRGRRSHLRPVERLQVRLPRTGRRPHRRTGGGRGQPRVPRRGPAPRPQTLLNRQERPRPLRRRDSGSAAGGISHPTNALGPPEKFRRPQR
jgi:hypothetical protein